VRVADEQKPLKVSDFRMFTPDGKLKPEYQDLENPSSASEEPPQAPKAAAEPPPEAASAPAEGAESTELVDLVRSLATSAYAAMGLLAEPGAKVAVDLPGARRLIDWLAMLERKTRNNLSFGEQNLLTRVLYELRLAFVEASGPPGSAPR
jgi:hypothetical protein